VNYTGKNRREEMSQNNPFGTFSMCPRCKAPIAVGEKREDGMWYHNYCATLPHEKPTTTTEFQVLIDKSFITIIPGDVSKDSITVIPNYGSSFTMYIDRNGTMHSSEKYYLQLKKLIEG
jgi:hypothetical protein